MATFITEQSKIHTLVIRIYIDLHQSIIHQIFICRNCKFGTILVHVYSKNMNDVILKRALYCQSRLCMSLYLIHTCTLQQVYFQIMCMQQYLFGIYNWCFFHLLVLLSIHESSWDVLVHEEQEWQTEAQPHSSKHRPHRQIVEGDHLKDLQR